ncbi:MAG: FAD-binding oxidoreductase, partial [Acidobacteria bacterium]|nr:FAD-binding oxidoreductase [Acidobacteriota bacterium]
MATADAVIVGGGVIGASIAYHLATRGVRNIVVLERDTLGSGSTSKNAGGIRQQFSSEINVRLSQRSVPRFEAFEAEMGIDPAFRQVGYLFLITAERDVAPFERSLALWKRLGVPAIRIERDAVHALFPEIVTADVRFATFCAKDGHADPNSILQGYVRQARHLGVRFVEGAAVTAIDREAGNVSAVHAG